MAANHSSCGAVQYGVGGMLKDSGILGDEIGRLGDCRLVCGRAFHRWMGLRWNCCVVFCDKDCRRRRGRI